MATSVRILQANVFEDGLTDAPGAIGLSEEFTTRFNRLLLSLSDDGAGNPFLCFKKSRDFSVLPAVAHLSSAAEFFGFLELVYDALYHVLGGEARLANNADGAHPPGPDLANCLRTLFLSSAVDTASGAAWSSPKFEAELDKALGGNATAAAAADRIRAIRGRVFDTDHGILSWDRKEVEAIWKRGNNVWHDKWCKDLAAFLAADNGGADAQQQAALASICQSDTEELAPGCMQSFIYVQLDAAGAPLRVTTCTMHSAIRLLLTQMCKHSLRNEGASAALCEFSATDVAPSTPEARADLVAEPLMAEVESWSERASIAMRHTKFCQTIADASPSIITLVEFDAQWRRLQLPANRAYISARDLESPRGIGQATIMFDSEQFAAVAEDELAALGVASPLLPGSVRSQNEQGTGESPVRPKSSCVLLLRQRESSSLVLVAAVHLESGPPSDTKKVGLRRQQVRALLSEVSQIAKMLLQAGLKCTVALGGDYNATREEFVHGNLPTFYNCSGTKAIRPPLQAPVVPLNLEAMGEPIARMDEAEGGLVLLCEGVDGGELAEATFNHAERLGSAGGRMGCTRAGKSMVIDFVFYGTIGGREQAASTVHVLASDEEARQAADEGYGVLNAVMRWGSDHLPVACDIQI